MGGDYRDLDNNQSNRPETKNANNPLLALLLLRQQKPLVPT